MKRSFLHTGLLTVVTLLVCLFLGVTSASAAGELSNLICDAQPNTAGNTAIRIQSTAKGSYLFLPAAADFHKMTFWFDGPNITLTANGKTADIQSGTPVDLSALLTGSTAAAGCQVTLRQNGETLLCTVMRSENIPAIFLTSPDTAHSRAWVELNKENKAKNAGMVMLRPNGTALYDGVLNHIKGRGHSTWEYPKKPYQIKLGQETDLLETGNPVKAEKSWCLLANYCDETLLHNSATFAIATRMGMAYTSGFQQVDLYYDGEYRGTYLLTEKVEVSDGRVAVTDLEKAFEQFNPNVKDFDALPTAIGTNALGGSYQYVSGLTSPWDLSGGYLLEIDYEARATAEKSWFSTNRGTYVACKSPEYLSQTGADYVSSLFQQMENAIYNGGKDPSTGRPYSDFVDEDSLARCYVLAELSQDPDSFLSSTFFYKPVGVEKFYVGPVWDFDSCYGSTSTAVPVQTILAARTPICKALLAIPSFQQKVSSICSKELTGIVGDLVRSSASGSLPTLSFYAAEVSASQKMNAVLWPEASPANYLSSVDGFRTYLSQRTQWMTKTMSSWDNALLDDAAFSDVPQDMWFHDAISYVVKNGLFNGVSYHMFCPQNTMTRAMAVTVLYRMAGEPSVSMDASSYSDVAVSAWYAKAVLWASANGISTGYLDNTFRPEQGVTRQEFATFLYRYSGSPVVSASPLGQFPDAVDVGPFAITPMSWAVNTGLLKGDNYGLLTPKDLITRAQVATLLQRYLEK